MYLALWLLATLIAVLLSLNMLTAAYVDGEYIPVGNDSFYHARRILDAAVGERGFYQFDQMIHVPEGSWITWPWGYDFLMALALSTALAVNPALEPMAFIAHIPVVWLLINVGLLTLIAWQIGLRPAFAALALLGFALSPLTQTMHGVGIIDHHYIELTFMLATVFAGLKFFATTRRPIDAVILGLVLGLAPAFHNGLFILQVPVLACFAACWVTRQMTGTKDTLRFSTTLFISTLLVTLPSGPFRDMQFEFWALSWFHVYIAGCTAVCTVFLAYRQFQSINAAIFAALALILAIPLATKVLLGAAFLSGELSIIKEVHEVQSPIARFLSPNGLIWITSFFSWLFFTIPILIVAFAIRIWKANDPVRRFFAIAVVFGLFLLLAQYRFHPFGFWAILIGCLLLTQEFCDKFELTKLVAIAIPLVVFAFAYQPSIKNRLFQRYPPGNTIDYAATRTLYPSLAEECAKKSGIAISYNDDGHYVRYHTDCSVISNNFLMTPQHEEKVVELDRLLQMNPEQLLEEAPHVDYVFARLFQIFSVDENGLISPSEVGHVASVNAPLFVGLIFADELPEEYVLLDEVRVEDDRDFAFGRVYKIVRD